MTDVAAVVAAAASSRGIGSGGNLVWRLPSDMSHFKHVTMTPPVPTSPPQPEPEPEPSSGSVPVPVPVPVTNAVIMGRKTWESIPPQFRPLENRMNIILSRSPSYSAVSEDCDGDNDNSNSNSNDNIMVCTSLQEAMAKLNKQKEEHNNVGHVFVIGGGEVYKEGLESGLINRVIYTMVDNLSKDQEDSFDTWFPELKEENWDCFPYPGQEIQVTKEGEEKKDDNEENEETTHFQKNATIHTDKKSGVKFQFLDYRRKLKKTENKNDIEEGAHVNPEEMQYLQMCRDIIENGVERGDRTGTGTLSKFGTQMRFSLRDGTLPLLTTKRTFWRGVAEELLWFVKVSYII